MSKVSCISSGECRQARLSLKERCAVRMARAERTVDFNLKPPDTVLAVILGLNDLSDDHIIPGLFIYLDINPLPLLMAFYGLSQRGFNAD